jgi:hypothetical protein
VASKKKTPANKRAAQPKTKAVTAAVSKAVAPGGWRATAVTAVAKSKEALAKLPAASGNFVSFRNGQATLAGNRLDNPLPVIIIAHGYERTYYSRPYQPDSISAPDCYSFDGDGPHEQSQVPQSDRCAQCRFNEFGSATNGKGKGCKEGARFAMIHADALNADDPVAAIASAQIVQARLSVLNSKGFRAYAGYFEDMPMWTSVTQIEVTPDSKSQYATSFSNLVVEMDDDILDAIAARVAEAEKLIVEPYPEPQDPAPKPAAKKRAAKRKF